MFVQAKPETYVGKDIKCGLLGPYLGILFWFLQKYKFFLTGTQTHINVGITLLQL